MRYVCLFSVLLSLHIAFGAITGADIDESSVSALYYVNQSHPSASDSNAGTSSNAPLLTVYAAFSKAATSLMGGAGTKIIIFPGVYRENPMNLYATSWSAVAKDAVFVIEGTEKHNVILTGAESWTTGWSEVTGYPGVYEHFWPYDWSLAPHDDLWEVWGIEVGALGMRREMIVYNDAILQQELIENYVWYDPDNYGTGESGRWVYTGYRGLDVLSPGTFGVVEGIHADSNRPASMENKIYMMPPAGTDISFASIEVPLRETIFLFKDKDNVVLRNLTLQNSAAFLKSYDAAARMYSSDFLIDNCIVRQNNGGGMSFGNEMSNITVRQSYFFENGANGASGSRLDNLILIDTESSRNNWRGHLGGVHGWSLAGMKLMGPGYSGTIYGNKMVRHRALENFAHGHWFDHCEESPGPIDITELYSVGNLYGAQLYIEKQAGPIAISNSFLWSTTDGLRGIYAIASNVVVSNSIVFSQAQEAVFLDDRSYSISHSYLWHVVDSLIAGKDSGAYLYRNGSSSAQYDDFLSSYTGSGNTFFNPDNSMVFNGTGGVLTNFTGWKNATGSDASSTFADPFIYGKGFVSWERWDDIPGTSLSALTGSAAFHGDAPTEIMPIPLLETLNNYGNNYGTRIRALLYPPAAGDYTFAVSGADSAELYLSTDAAPANTQRIAYTTSATAFRSFYDAASQTSAVISLIQTNAYYFEILQKAGNTDKDHVSVFWKKPGDTDFVPIPCAYAAPYLRVPENPPGLIPGIEYGTYEGSWTTLPDFSNTDMSDYYFTNVISLAVRPAGVDDNFGVRFTGYIAVPSNGIYTFSTTSDDGSKLYIGTTCVVDNDGTHGAQQRSGNIGLYAGTHAFTVDYFDATGDHSLDVMWEGPGVTNQTIQASALWREHPAFIDGEIVSAMSLSLRGEYEAQNAYIQSWGSGCAFGTFVGTAGSYIMYIDYYDETDGTAHMDVYANDALLDSWDWDGTFGGGGPTAESLTSRFINVNLEPGDTIKLFGKGQGGEAARVKTIRFELVVVPEPVATGAFMPFLLCIFVKRDAM